MKIDFEKLSVIFKKEHQLIELKNDLDSVFVGDTHGDFDASQKVIEKYPLEKNRILFLGDYVDRGPKSKKNIDYLLEIKQKYPDNLFLLMGNHEFTNIPFHPCDFWDSLDRKERKRYAETLYNLPLAVSIDEIIALHGALPNTIASNINEISKNYYDALMPVIWGDFADKKGESLGDNPRTGRPEFGKDWFERMMNKLGKNVLIRGHDYHAPERMYDDRCLTLFTTDSYNKPGRTIPRRIAILKAGKEAKTINDLIVEEI